MNDAERGYSPPIDNDQRLAALNPLESVCVTAPAGSGKTELLSQRVLRLLATADQPEEILAITFTRKAAAEMHHRIIQALRNAKASEQPQQAHKKLSWQLARQALERDQLRGWHLLENPYRLKIQTIDSFCASLTRQMPILSNFGSQPQVADDPEQCYRQAVHDFFAVLEQDNPFADELFKLLQHLDNDVSKVERLMSTLLARRDQWLGHIGIAGDPATAKRILENTLQQIITDNLLQLSIALRDLAPELLPLMDYAGCNMQWQRLDSPLTLLAGIVELPPVSVDAVDQWLAMAELLLTKTGSWRKSIDKRAGFPTETQDGDKALAKELKARFISLLANLQNDAALQPLLQELRHLPSAHYPAKQWQLLESLTRLLPGLVAQLSLVFQQQGEVDYSQISMAALQALGDGLNPSELAMKLDYQLRHILVDEFQDTASTQYRLLQRLVEGWAEHNANNPQRPNTLFIVGDGMQSIYGFREANVGLFLEARKIGVNGVKLQDLPLTVNFRSDPLVVEWINATFSQAFPQQENLSRGAVPFEHAAPFNATNDSATVEVLVFAGDDARQREAAKVVELVQAAQHQNSDASIAVLVRNRGHLRDIVPALTKAGINWHATDIDPLASYSPIIDLLSLTKALFNIADRISWVALLRTPWLGLSNNDLHSLLSGAELIPVYTLLNDKKRLAKLSKQAAQRLVEVRTILNAAFSERQRLGARSWVEGVWQALGGASTVGSVEEYEIIDDYFALLESFQRGDIIESLSSFEVAVNKLYARPTTQNCQLQLMTIHKSKGLEFDVVILPAAGRQPRSDDKSLLMWREYINADGSNNGLVISPLAASGDDDAIYQHLRYEKTQSTVLENTRLFYVAATRAISQLFILTTAEMDNKGEQVKPPSSNSLIASCWDEIASSATVELPTVAATEQFGLNFAARSSRLKLQRIEAGWQPPTWSFQNPLSEFYLTNNFDNKSVTDQNAADKSPANSNNMPELLGDPLPRCVGTVCHWVLEILVERGIDLWLLMDVSLRDQWLKSLLHYHQLPESRWEQAVDQIVTAINNITADSKGQWVLSNEHEKSATELPLLSCYADSVQSRSIDRCFVDEVGDLWIVDYKTSTPFVDESKAQFIERELAAYRSQLLEYKLQLTLRDNNQQPIRMALYFTHYPHFEEVLL